MKQEHKIPIAALIVGHGLLVGFIVGREYSIHSSQDKAAEPVFDKIF